MIFEEVQRFPVWIKGIVALPVVLLGLLVLGLWTGGSVPAGVLAIGGLLLILFVLLAVVHFAMRLVTTVDSAGFHLRIHPTGWSLLPRRMTRWDVPLGDVETCEIATYNSLRSTEFWGWHMWGLSAAKGGRYLYVMNPSGLTTGRGVRLRLRTGEMLLVGSARPEELVGAITQKQSRQN